MDGHIFGCVRSGNLSRSPLDVRNGIGGSSDDFLSEHHNKLVGIVGLGSVGSALYSVLSHFYRTVGYDIKDDYEWEPLLGAEAIFVCVQTPESDDGRLNCSHVEEVVERLSLGHYTGVVVIKSTLRIGFSEYLAERYPDIRLVYSPEFMSEKNAFLWTANPDRIVISGNPADMDYVQKLYSWAKDAEIIRTDYRSAEIGKLAHNSFIAMKVTFTNVIEDISTRGNASADDVMRIVYTDRRVRNSAHLTPHKGPYGGKCVPKDTSELINAFPDQTRLLKVADEINDFIIGKTVEIKPEKPLGTVR